MFDYRAVSFHAYNASLAASTQILCVRLDIACDLASSRKTRTVFIATAMSVRVIELRNDIRHLFEDSQVGTEGGSKHRRGLEDFCNPGTLRRTLGSCIAYPGKS